MGCDIHIIAEVKTAEGWKKNNKPVFKNPYYIPESDYKPFQVEFNAEPDGGRNYDWFAVLANVRNGRGFAGIKTGEGFNVISNPKGVPEDCCPEWKQTVKDWDCDMHSHSYLSLEELENFDWNQVTMKYGVVSLNQYKELKDTTDCPSTWSGAIGGGNVITIDKEKANQVLNGTVKELTKKPFGSDELITKSVDEWDIYVGHEWPVLYSDWFSHKIESTINPLKELAKEYEDVRIVFGFDN